MYELNEAWTAYFDELDQQKRLALFNDLAGRGDEAAAFCRALYDERYIDPKHPDRKVDTWLWKFVYLPGLYKRRKFLGGAVRKELEGTLKELHLDRPEALSEMEKTILSLEYRNAARRYLSTCRGTNYASSLLGLKKATGQEKLDRACEDIWSSSKGLALAAGLEENFKLWSEALYAELLEFDPDSRKHYAELEQKIQK